MVALAYAALGLREVMAGPSRLIAQEIRHDPVWTPLKADPRFEEILRSARTL